MSKYLILFNPYSDNGQGKANAEKIAEFYPDDELVYLDITEVSKDYKAFFESLKDENVILSGGDGTLNRFVNEATGYFEGHDIFYFAAGTGNDFMNDMPEELKGGKPFVVNKYITDLPECTVNGKKYLFFNGIGFGIDGYCCEVGDKIREEKPGQPINYTSIAIKGLLFHYKATHAKVTVDGVTKEFDKVYIAPTMNGRFYGGGMNAVPDQDRLNPDHTVSTMIYYGVGKLKALAVFPSIFKGEHVKHTEMVEVFKGHEIEVEFSDPCALQVDGETVLGVTKYTVKTK